eukprot:6063348-Amphidinium_carterae.1
MHTQIAEVDLSKFGVGQAKTKKDSCFFTSISARPHYDVRKIGQYWSRFYSGLVSLLGRALPSEKMFCAKAL